MSVAGLRRASIAALCVSFAFACSEGAPRNKVCAADGDCSSGLHCAASECVAVGQCASTQLSCADNSMCGAGSSCDGTCCVTAAGCHSNNDCATTPTTPVCDTSRNTCIGCRGNDDCVPGTICITSGACAQGCSTRSGSSAVCPSGESCLTGVNGTFCGATGGVPTVALTPQAGSFIRVGESGSAFPTVLTLTLSNTATSDEVVTVTAADADVTVANGGSFTIPAGSLTTEVKVTATGAHPAETLTARLGASTSTATIRVLGAAEEPAQLTLTPASVSVAAGGSTTLTLTTDIPAPPGTNVTVAYGNAALFSAAPNSVAFAADALKQTFAVTVDAASAGGTSTVSASIDGTAVQSGTANVTGTVGGVCAQPLAISMIYGDGGFAGTGTSAAAIWQSDFVEIHNRGTSPVGLNGFSVQYAPATSVTNASGVVALSNVSLAAGGYYLVALTCSATGCGAGGSPLPAPDQSSSSINMSFNNGKVFLVQGTTAIAFDATGAPVAGSNVIDAVGYGAANFGEGGTKAPVGSNLPDFRKNLGCTDTNDNAADWDNLSPPTPRNSAAPPTTCAVCGGTQ